MSLERILEPEVMDSEAEARVYDDMDHAEVNRQFVSDFLQFADGVSAFQDMLDVGTGTAQIPVELCLQYPDCRVMAMDLSANMLDLAVYNVEADDLAERITLIQSDAGQMVFEDDMFDAVISNSLIHHLPEPANCLGEMVRVVRDGGILFVQDLFRPNEQTELEQLVEQYTGNETANAQQLFRQSLQAALTVSEMRVLVKGLGFEPDTVQPTSDRHWTWAVR